jgi:2OG-Fe(II) oxygenase superfamily
MSHHLYKEEIMSNSIEYFNKNKYVVLQNALNREQCADLTKYMFDLFEQGKLKKDEQCPLSDAVYGDPIFDSILQKFAKPIGDATGLTLLPTYTYARIYRPGEILKKHTDRPSCEISATMTLGFDSKPIWPIFVDDKKEIPISLDIGELVIYRGCDVVHWRPEFKGKWHVQVFLHYVDANGPYKHHELDGRSDYGTTKKSNVQPQQTKEKSSPNSEIKFSKPIFKGVIIPSSTQNLFPGYFCVDNQNLSELQFNTNECQRIIDLTKHAYPTSASIGGSPDSSKISREIRSANIFVLENDDENKWIYEKIANVISVVNTLHFDYDIIGITHGIQLIEYRADSQIQGHYNWHVDSGNGDAVYRKISLTVQLSDPSDYEDCELIINNHGTEVVGTKQRGSVHLFPSYMTHKVTPVTKGVRYALVIWIHGSKRFR